MEVLLFLIVIVVVAAFLFKKAAGAPSDPIQQESDSAPVSAPSNQVALDALTRVTNTCQEVGGDGFRSLIVAASSDGKVSRDELRIVMWFCEAVGAKFLEDDVAYVSKLNAGVSMSVTSSAGGAANIVADCSDLDLPTLARLYAAHASIGKPWNKTAKRSRETLSVIERMIALKALSSSEIASPA